MRVLFTILSATGEFHPTVPVAQALLAAGHEVAFATGPAYCPAVEGVGFRCFPAGQHWVTPEERAVAVAHVQQLVAGRQRPFSALRDVFAGYLPPMMVADLLAIAREWPPDVLVRGPMELGGCVAADVLGIPHATCGPLFMFWEGAWHATAGEVDKPELDDLRRVYGLPPDPELVALHRYLCLATLPPAFLGPSLPIPPTVHFLRPVSFDRSGGEETLPDWIHHLPDRPTVHASLGTIQHKTPGVFPAILEGLRDEPINLIVALGRDQDPAQFGPQPDNVYLERYLPHSLLLPYCDVVITHGGFSSVMVGLNHGLPMVVIPLGGGDQPGNAARCAALGLAEVVPPDQRTPEAIRTATRTVLHAPRYRLAAQELQAAIAALPGPEVAVTLLERLAREKQPLPRDAERRSCLRPASGGVRTT
jgi:MGT family glycosyltransferase